MIIRCDLSFMCFSEVETRCEGVMLDYNDISCGVAQKIRDMLDKNFVGVYLFGSLVLGDFDEDFSDIDLMIVVKKDIDACELKKIQELQKYIFKKYPRFGMDGIEMLFVSTYTLDNYLRKKTFLTAVAPGNPLETIICKPEFLIYFYIVRNYGKTLIGVPKEKVFPEILVDDFVSMSNSVAISTIPQWKELCVKTLHEQFYSVITLCRALYVKENKSYPSKLQAKNWAEDVYPEFKDMIEYAWSLRGKWKKEDKPRDSCRYQEIINFFDFAESELCNES